MLGHLPIESFYIYLNFFNNYFITTGYYSTLRSPNDYLCDPCHSSCLECNGLSDTSCLKCDYTNATA